MPSTEQRQEEAANKRIAALEKDLNKSKIKIRTLEQDKLGLQRRVDHHDGRAKQLQAKVNDQDARIAKLTEEGIRQDPIGEGAYEVVTKKEQLINGRKRPKGTRLGFFTTIVGITPQVVVDSLHFGTAEITESDSHELYTELMAREDLIGQCAKLEIERDELKKQLAADQESGDAERVASLESQLEELKKELASTKGQRTKAENALDEANNAVSERDQAIEDQRARIAELEQQLKELGEDAGLGGGESH